METILIKPKSEKDMALFVELADKLGVEIHTLSYYDDILLLARMEQNRKSQKTNKAKVIQTLSSIISGE